MYPFSYRPPTEMWRNPPDSPIKKRSPLERMITIGALIGTMSGAPTAFSETRFSKSAETAPKPATTEELSRILHDESLTYQLAPRLEQAQIAREAEVLTFTLNGVQVQETRGTLRTIADTLFTQTLRAQLPGYEASLAQLCEYPTKVEGQPSTRIDAEEAMLLYGNQINFKESNLTQTIDQVTGSEQARTRRLLSPIINRTGAMGGAHTVGGIEMIGLKELAGKYTNLELRTWHQQLYNEARTLVAHVLDLSGLEHLDSGAQQALEQDLLETVRALVRLRITQAQIGYAVAEGSSHNEAWIFTGESFSKEAPGMEQLKKRLHTLQKELQDLHTYLPEAEHVQLTTDLTHVLATDLTHLFERRGQKESTRLDLTGSQNTWMKRAAEVPGQLGITRQPDTLAIRS